MTAQKIDPILEGKLFQAEEPEVEKKDNRIEETKRMITEMRKNGTNFRVSVNLKTGKDTWKRVDPPDP